MGHAESNQSTSKRLRMGYLVIRPDRQLSHKCHQCRLSKCNTRGCMIQTLRAAAAATIVETYVGAILLGQLSKRLNNMTLAGVAHLRRCSQVHGTVAKMAP